MESNSTSRSDLATAQNLEDFVKVVECLKDKYLPYHNGEKLYSPEVEGIKDTAEINDCNLKLPPWISQPYVRMPPSEHIKKMEEKKLEILVFYNPDSCKINLNQNLFYIILQNNAEELKRHYEDSEGNSITRKKMKKLRRIQRRPIKPDSQQTKRPADICVNCPNPLVCL